MEPANTELAAWSYSLRKGRIPPLSSPFSEIENRLYRLTRHLYNKPFMNTGMDSFGFALVSSTVEANRIYWQFEINYEGCDKATFIAHHRLFRTSGMQFGLYNASSTLQQTIDVEIKPMKWHFTLVHVSDIITCLCNEDDHILYFTLYCNSQKSLPRIQCKNFSYSQERLTFLACNTGRKTRAGSRYY